MGEDERREKAAELRRVLERYRGGRFETGSSGGAGGMVFFRDAHSALFYIGGFNIADAHRIVMALNLVLELLERRPSRERTEPAPFTNPSPPRNPFSK